MELAIGALDWSLDSADLRLHSVEFANASDSDARLEMCTVNRDNG